MGIRGSKFISMVLVFMILFTGILPQTVSATPIKTPPQISEGKGIRPDFVANKKPKPIRELEELRDQHTKHYLNDDGSRTVDMSPVSVHYKDSKGKWQDISNKLVPSDNQEFALQNEANDIKTQFAENTAKPSIFSIKSRQGYGLSWNLLDANKVKAVKSEESVLYPDIFSGVDLEYKQLPDGVKENIILKNPDTTNYFTFRIKTDGLTPVLHEDNSVGFYADPRAEEFGELKFLIPRPYMIDSNNEVSQLVTLQLQETDQEDEYELTSIADYDWLMDPDRAYPVTIDPIVTKHKTSFVYEDTYIVESQPYKYYNSTYMTVGYDSVLGGRTRALTKMNLPTLPEGAIVTDAYFRMYKYTKTSYENEMVLSRIKQGWSPETLTWDENLSTIDKDNEKTQTYMTKVAGDHIGWVDFNVWSIVKGWYGKDFPNNGFMIYNNTEGNPLSFFYASENGSNVPHMQITYIADPLGLNSYWGYANTAWGSVNTLSGNFLSSTTDFSLPGLGIPITVSRTYNSRGNLSGIFGNKWFSNLDISLTHQPWGYVLTDSSGAERPFLLASDGKTFIAPTNYPIQLYKNTDGTFTIQEAYINPGIIDKAEYKIKTQLPSLTFSSDGKLIRLEDGKGNKTSLTWSPSSLVIEDATKRIVTVNRDSSGRATRIIDHENNTKVNYVYDEATNNLTKVTYLDNITNNDSAQHYEWDNGVITKYKDMNNTPTYLNYKDDQMVSIGSVNMLSNPSFESEAAWQSVEPYLWEKVMTNAKGSTTISKENPRFGKSSLKIESTPQSDASGGNIYVQQLVKVKPELNLTLSTFIKKANLDGNALLKVKELKEDKTIISTKSSEIDESDVWSPTNLEFTTSKDTQYLLISAEVEHSQGQSGGIAYFDGIQLVEGAENPKFFGHTDFREYIESTTQTTMLTSPTGEKIKYQNNKMGNPILVMNDVGGKQAKTIMSWDSADRLRSITPPEQAKDGGEGKQYTFKYDFVGNMIEAKDPLDRTITYDYYFNHLQQTTLPDQNTVSNTWDPLNLTGVTTRDQALNSKAYIYNTNGNLEKESNTLGVADNRIFNSNLEAGYNSKPAPVFSHPNAPRFVNGKFGQALTIEKGNAERSGEMLTLPTGLFNQPQGLIEAWVKPLRNFDSSSSNNIQMIVDAAGTGYQGLILAIDQYGKFYIQAGTGTGTMKAVSTTTAQKDTWYHVTGRWTLSGVMIYINGVKEGTATGSNKISFTQSPVVGRQASANIRYLDGLIDDLRISNLARTDSAILASYSDNKPSGADANTTYKLNFDQSFNPVYQPTSWIQSGGRLNQAEYDPTAPYGGSHVLHIDPGTAAYASQITGNIALNGVDQFIISGDIKVKGSGNDGIRLQVNWYNSSNSEIGQDRVFSLTKEKNWQRYSMVLDPPAGAVYAKVLPIVYKGFEGYFDNLQFEKSPQVREYNALENSSFERDLTQWSRSDSFSSVTSEEKYSGGKSLKIQRSSTSGTSYAESQTIIPVKKGQVYTVSGLIKTVDFNSVGTDGGAWIDVDYPGSSNEPNQKKFVTADSDWTKYVQTLTPEQDGFAKIRLKMKNASGKAYFDNLRLSYGNQITEYGYDANENYVTQVTNQLGKVITYEKDGYGQVTKVTTPEGDKDKLSTSYSYNGHHRLNKVTDTAGNVATYTYDGNGNVIGVEIKANGSKVYSTTFEYDEYGNMVKEVAKPKLSDSSLDKVTEHLYDEAGRLIGKVNPGGSRDNPDISLNYEYFGLDSLKILDGSKYAFDYNTEGQITKEEIYANGVNKSKEFLYAYDKLGRLESLIEKDGGGSEVARIAAPTGDSGKKELYTDTDQLNGFDLTYKGQNDKPITYWFTYLTNGLVKTVKGAGKEFKLFFTEGSQLASKENPNKTSDEFTYNAAGQAIESKTNRVNKSVSGNQNVTEVKTQWFSMYEYDADGRIEKIIGQGAGSPSADYTYNNGTEKLNRLTQAVITKRKNNNPLETEYEYTFDYVYDAMGNILEMDVLNGGVIQKQAFAYNNDNQITNSGFTYDNNGNLLQGKIKGVNYQYSYDKANRLTEVKDGTGNEIASYTYDAQGQRLTKTTSEGTITYHYFNGDVLFETKSGDANNILHALYIRSPQGKPLAVSMNYNLSTPDSNTWYYYHYNAHGDVVAVTDAGGNVFREYVYDPYGNIISVKDGSGNNIDVRTDTGFNHAYTYAGYGFDKETGLYYLNARYYEAGIGRFLTKDSVFTPNQYAYAAGDPVNYVDPSGYFLETLLDVANAIWSAGKLWRNPSWTNAGFLAWDVGAAFIPIIPGSYTAKATKLAAEADNVADVAKVGSKAVSKGAGSKIPSSSTKVINTPEVKAPNAIKSTNVTNAWDNYLGKNTTNINPRTGVADSNRIFSADGTKSIRFGNHEMGSIGTPKGHFHYETWRYDAATNTMTVTNTLQRIIP